MTNRNPDLIADKILKKSPTFLNHKYKVFTLDIATGVAYITDTSHQYLSGQLRMRGRDNGRYPYGYKETIDELFGSSSGMNMIEVCSGSIASGFGLYTVDINPDKYPSFVCDGQRLPKEFDGNFDRWYCDPPYNRNTATEMYDTKLPSFSKLLTAGSKVVKAGGLLFFLLGNKNMQWCPQSLIRIGLLFITIVPNQEVRALHIYYKLI